MEFSSYFDLSSEDLIGFDAFAIDIESKLRRIEEDPEGSGTKHLYDCMQGVNSIANRAFESLFERQVDRT